MDYRGYTLGSGSETLKDWIDHFISHKGSPHASIISRFGIDVSSHGDPAGSPISGL